MFLLWENGALTATAAWFCGTGHQVGIPGIPRPPCPEPTAVTAACCGKLAGCPGCGWSVAMETQSQQYETNYNHMGAPLSRLCYWHFDCAEWFTNQGCAFSVQSKTKYSSNSNTKNVECLPEWNYKKLAAELERLNAFSTYWQSCTTHTGVPYEAALLLIM